METNLDLYLFNSHDIVVVESHFKLHKWICEYKSYDNNQLHFYKGTYVISPNEKENKSKLIYNSYYDITSSDIIRIASSGEIAQFERMIKKNNTSNHMPNVLAKLLDHIKNTSKEELEKEFNELEEWSKVGPTIEEFMTFCECVNKKPKYPTTYEECWKVRFKVDGETILKEFHNISGYYSWYLGALQKLLCCRDAYWKIAGEQMGLGKLWEPDWGYNKNFYCIKTIAGKIEKRIYSIDNCILAFPTEEMRDAFYENFKELINSCKELL